MFSWRSTSLSWPWHLLPWYVRHDRRRYSSFWCQAKLDMFVLVFWAWLENILCCVKATPPNTGKRQWRDIWTVLKLIYTPDTELICDTVPMTHTSCPHSTKEICQGSVQGDSGHFIAAVTVIGCFNKLTVVPEEHSYTICSTLNWNTQQIHKCEIEQQELEVLMICTILNHKK